MDDRKQYWKEYRLAHPEKIARASRRYNLKKKFGLSEQAYLDMLETQHYRCAICGGKKKERELAVDHDHKTGQIRGLLCAPCNVSLGRLETHWHGIMSYLNVS